MTISSQSIIFATPAYLEMAAAVAQQIGLQVGELKTEQFPDGERYLRVVSSVKRRDVICMGGTFDPQSTLDLYDLASAVVEQGARRLIIVIPFLGYSTMERASLRGEAVVAKYRARLLSSIPHATARNLIVFFDLHSPGIPHYMENGVGVVHLRSGELLGEKILEVGGCDFVLGSTDAGRAKWVETMANQIGVEAAFILKRRTSGGETNVLALNAKVDGRTVVIYDDMIRSGGSLISAAQAYRAAGATNLIAVATHGIFTEGALTRLADSRLFQRVVCTDSHPRALVASHPLLEVVSCAPVISRELSLTLQ